MTEAEIRDWLIEQLAEVCFLDVEEIDVRRPMAEYGISSRDAVTIAGELEEALGVELPATLLWDHPTIAGLAAAISGESSSPEAGQTAEPEPVAEARESVVEDAIAVVGIGCRFPGEIEGPDAFWSLLREGRDAVGTVPEGRWSDPEAASKAGGYLREIDAFDAEYFSISPGEARRMDPQQRMLLEVTREALRHAAVSPDSLRGSQTGVFVGISGNEYAYRGLADPHAVDAWSATGGSLAIAANRLSYLFDLRGPSMSVDTACSSSLVAVHNAIRALRAGDCDRALAGGANLLLGPSVTASFDKLGVSSPSGRCRPFSADADGIVRAEGAAVLVLKRLDQARADGDRVLAVLAGSAVNSDGRTNGLTAPNMDAQRAVLRAAYADAAVDPHAVDFVETHGTGTLLGDPIEARALGSVLSGPNGEPVRLGSVKSNLGHLEAAAGIAGLIKSVLALWHGELPASLHYTAPNPHIDFDGLGLEVANRARSLPQGTVTAGVSGFGFGGTNAHIVVRRAEPLEGERSEAPHRILLGEVDSERLAEYAGVLADAVDSGGLDVGELAYTSDRVFSGTTRAAVVAENAVAASAGLRALADGRSEPEGEALVLHGSEARCPGAVWVFSGQGSQWAGMGRELLATEPVFAAVIDELDPLLAAECGFSVRELISGDVEPERMAVVQPALFAMQLGFAELLRAHGQRPAAVLGHSMGEVAAAVVSGALDRADAVRVIARRSRLLDSVSEHGTMGSIALPAQAVTELLDGESEVGIAAINSRTSTVISGTHDGVHRVLEAAKARGASAKQVKVTAPAHSPVLDPLIGTLTEELAELTVRAPEIPCYHTTSEQPAEPVAFDADYWGRNFREPVRFAAAVEAAAADGFEVFLELSPHPVLTGAIEDVLTGVGRRRAVVLGTMDRHGPVTLGPHAAVAALRLAGFGEPASRGRITTLPAPVWHRRSHWVAEPDRQAGHPLLGTHVRLPDGKTHVWQRDQLPEPERISWLDDRLGAAEYLEMAMAAAAEVLGDGPLEAERLRLSRALPLADPAQLCTSLYRERAGVRVTIGSRVGGAPMREHAEVMVRRRVTEPSNVDGAEWTLETTSSSSGWYCAPELLTQALGEATELASARRYGDPSRAVRARTAGEETVLLDAEGTVLFALRGPVTGECEQPASLAEKLYRIEWEQRAIPEVRVEDGTVAVLDGPEALHADLRAAGLRVNETLHPLPDTVILCVPSELEVPSGHEWFLRLYGVVRELVEAGAAHTRLVLLTRAAASVLPEDPVDPVAAAVRASVRLLAYEHPELRTTWLDTDDPAVLPRELAANTGEDEIAWRAGTRSVARLTRADVPVRANQETVVRTDGGYVVTGGLGGIGLVLARWLAESGAARIVLNGRSAPKPEACAAIEEIQALGTEVLVETGDLADAGVAERLVAAADAGETRIRGVLHGAAIIDDRVVLRADEELLSRVWQPKVTGAWRLHTATLGKELDFWLGFSSMMAVLSFPGHAAYSPANACLDAIVAHRRALGLPANTVNWGVWAKAGAVADGSVLGDIGACDPVENIEALEAILAADVPAIGVTRPLEGHVDKLPDYVAATPFLERLVGERAERGDWPGLQAVLALEPEQARERLEARLRERVADIMGLAESGVDTRAPLPSIGVDSLVAVRIRNGVQHDTGELLPPSLLLRGASLDEVADWLVEAVLGHAAQPRSGEAGSNMVPPRDAAERLVESVCSGVLDAQVGMTQHWVDIADDAALVEIAEQLTRRSDHVVTAAALRDARTVERAAALVREPENPDDPVRVLRSGAEGTRPLLLFHPGGGDTLVYRQLVDQLEPDLPVYGFDRLDEIPEITDRVERYLPLLREIQPTGPYRLAGWSFGGALAYEMASRLVADGEQVELVAMIDTLLPMPLPEGMDEAAMLEVRFSKFCEVLRANYGMDITMPYQELARLDEDEQIDRIIERVESLGLINADVAPAIIRHQRTSYQDVQALQRFRPRYIGARVVLYSAIERHEDGIRDPIFDRMDQPKGWDEVLGTDLEIVPSPGHHLSILDPPNVNEVARHLRELLSGKQVGAARQSRIAR